MTGALRSFHTAIAAAKARMQAEWEAGRERKDVGSGARLAPAMPPATALNTYTGMQLVEAHDHAGAIVLELAPLGRMSRRLVLVEGDNLRVTDISDPSWQGTHRNRRGVTTRDDEQAQIDIGDDRYEREREDRE